MSLSFIPVDKRNRSPPDISHFSPTPTPPPAQFCAYFHLTIFHRFPSPKQPASQPAIPVLEPFGKSPEPAQLWRHVQRATEEMKTKL